MTVNENISDADLERFLRRRERNEYAALGSEQPPPELDALVLGRARAALDEDAGRATWRRRRWPAITALAATVVLSFAVIVRIALENGQSTLVPTTISTVPTTPSAASPTPAPAQMSPPAAAGGTEVDLRGFAEPPGALADRARADVPAAEVPTAELPRAAIEAQIRAETERAPLTSSPDTAAKARIAPLGRTAESKKAESKEDGLLQSSKPAANTQERRERLHAEEVRSTVVTPAQPAQAPRAQDEMIFGAAPPERAAAAEQTSSVQESEVAVAAPAEPPPAGNAEPARWRDPRAWLQQIERLRALGRDEEAAREMQRFLKAYPDYPRSGETESGRPAQRAPTR